MAVEIDENVVRTILHEHRDDLVQAPKREIPGEAAVIVRLSSTGIFRGAQVLPGGLAAVPSTDDGSQGDLYVELALPISTRAEADDAIDAWSGYVARIPKRAP